MLSSYFTGGLESCPGVELGRTIPEGDVFQWSLSLKVCGETPCERGLYSGVKGEAKFDGGKVDDAGVVPVDRDVFG